MGPPNKGKIFLIASVQYEHIVGSSSEQFGAFRRILELQSGTINERIPAVESRDLDPDTLVVSRNSRNFKCSLQWATAMEA